MTEQTSEPQEFNPVERSAELYEYENQALAIANIYDEIEFSKDNPTQEDINNTGRAEDIWEGTVEDSDQFAHKHMDAIHEAAIAEAAKRVAEIQDRDENSG